MMRWFRRFLPAPRPHHLVALIERQEQLGWFHSGFIVRGNNEVLLWEDGRTAVLTPGEFRLLMGARIARRAVLSLLGYSRVAKEIEFHSEIGYIPIGLVLRRDDDVAIVSDGASVNMPVTEYERIIRPDQRAV